MSNWSNEETEILKNYYDSNMTIKNIVIKLGRSRSSIVSKLVASNYYSTGRKREVKSLDIILLEVMRKSGIKKDILLSKTRKREVVQYRQLCHYYGKLLTKSSLVVVGKYFGNSDHATVLHSMKTINNLIETDSVFRKIHDDVLKRIKKSIFNKSKNLNKELQIKNQIKSIKSSLNIHLKIELNDLIKNLKNE